MKYLITAAIATLLFAAINPAEVQAQTIEPPKIFQDGIIPPIEIKPLEQPLVASEYKEFVQADLVEPKKVEVKPRPVKDSSNTYAPGNCTWYAKSKRPDLPNNLGNADTWYERAKAQGIPVGTEPRVGAVGMTKAYMHVTYIVGVNGDSVELQEMNYKSLGVVSSRTAPASEFLYIY